MLARLWWKEYRFFGPAWLILGLAVTALQWFMATMGTQNMWAALSWAVLYAFAVGAVAFAGERESGNLAFLDALPVDRRTLWVGKASFGLVTSLGLALLFGGIAWLVQTLQSDGPLEDSRTIVRETGVLLFEAIAWGLLWSSISRNPLLAGAMAVVSVGVVVVVSNATAPVHSLSEFDRRWLDHGKHLLAGLVALAISAFVFIWQPRFGTVGWEFRSNHPTSRIEARPASIGRGLLWQTWREGWTVGVLFGVVAILLPAIAWIKGGELDSGAIWFLAELGALLAGLSVFGTEYQSGHRRFLVQHGVAPGKVWGWKVGIWGLFMLAVLPIVIFQLRLGMYTMFRSRVEPSCLLFDAFAVGVICGMAIRRRITAALVAVIVLIGIGVSQMVLVTLGMIPAWSMALTPSLLLVVSRAWVGDWLLDRDGIRPWLRLGVLLAVPFGLLGSVYVGYRAYGATDIGRQFDSIITQPVTLPPEENAAEAYRRIANQILADPTFFRDQNGSAWIALNEVIETGSSPDQAEVERWRTMNLKVIEEARKISKIPRADFGPPSIRNDIEDQQRSFRGLWMVAQLLAVDARESLARGDLIRSWDDILALFRMSDHLSSKRPTIIYLLRTTNIHHWAAGLAFEWLGDSHQTSESVRKALADLKRLPPVPNFVESLRAESSFFEQMLVLPSEDLVRIIYGVIGNKSPSMTETLLMDLGMAPPWERERARRIGRQTIAKALKIAVVEPWQRDPNDDRIDGFDPTFGGSPLTRMIFPGLGNMIQTLDRELVNRRALELSVAIKAWQLDHGGQSPETLEALVPGLLERLPLDPYSGKAFGYLRSKGQAVRPPMVAFNPDPRSLRVSKPDQPLIYSVGPDRNDNGGKFEYGLHDQQYQGDYLFAVP